MPLFDINNTPGEEAATLVRLASVISECEAAQELTENTSGTEEEKAAATLGCITLGPAKPPANGAQYTIDELGNEFCQFQLYVPPDAISVVRKSDSSVDQPDELHVFALFTRRLVRESEDRNDVYMHFLSLVGKLAVQIIQAAETHDGFNPLQISVQRVQGPSFNSYKSQTGQGEYIFAMHQINWGDAIEE